MPMYADSTLIEPGHGFVKKWTNLSTT